MAPTTILLLVPMLAAAQVASIEVSETAGLRRFGYPVRARMKTQAAPDQLRLSLGNHPVPAQFTRIQEGLLEVDFAVSLGPWEKRLLTVERGAPAPASSPMTLEQTATAYVVRYPEGLTFRVPKNLAGLLESAETSDAEYLAAGSPGLLLKLRNQVGHRVVQATSRITKSGPLACAFRFDSTEKMERGTVKSAIEMEFPRSKSWAEVRWTVEDPNRLVSDLVAELNLRVEGQPLLVDFGAGSTVYATVRPGQSARMQANGASWNIDVNGESYAVGRGQRAEGWAHIMDRRRATAVAMEGFGDPDASIEASSNGRLRIERDRLSGTGKSFHFWVHFVPMPVQIGAATSPQSMMHPLSVHVAGE